MATIRFYTRSKNDKLATVFVRFIDSRSVDIRIPTPFRIYPSYWNEEKQALKQRILYSEVFTEAEAKDIQDKFLQLKDFILREHFKLTHQATKEWLKATIDKFYFKGTPGNESLLQYIDRYIKEAESGKRLASSGSTKKRFAATTIRGLKGFKLSFETFCNESGKQYNFNDITVDFYNDFLKHFYSRSCGANYIGRLIKTLKTIMRQAREEGLHSNMEIERKAFKTISEEVENIYLTEEELKKLYELDVAENKTWDIVRDVFLVGCYTSQRYSDYSKLNKSNIKVINGLNFIELIQQKTGEKCIIPIRPELDVILKKYNYNLPKTFEQKVNENIKRIAEKAGITEKITVENNVGGLKVKKEVSKCDLIKTHTARRTGCTLAYLAGIQVIDIMKISGHKTPKEFLKYIRVGKEETAINLANHPYYAGNILKIAH